MSQHQCAVCHADYVAEGHLDVFGESGSPCVCIDEVADALFPQHIGRSALKVNICLACGHIAFFAKDLAVLRSAALLSSPRKSSNRG